MLGRAGRPIQLEEKYVKHIRPKEDNPKMWIKQGDSLQKFKMNKAENAKIFLNYRNRDHENASK